MRLLIFGDIYGRVGRNALKKELSQLQQRYKPDFTIANVDNVTSGRGAIEKHIRELESAGVDIMMGGDHIFDNYSKICDYLSQSDSKLLRFANLYDETVAGVGYKVFEKNGKKLLAIHIQGEVFMNYRVKNPFLEVENILENFTLEELDGVIVDMHKETAPEGYGLAYHLAGKVSFIYGTHTHIQTNDEIILPNGVGIISDIGMTGPLYSVIGATYESVKNRFLTGINKGKIEQELDKNYVLSACVIDIENNKCVSIEKIRIRSAL